MGQLNELDYLEEDVANDFKSYVDKYMQSICGKEKTIKKGGKEEGGEEGKEEEAEEEGEGNEGEEGEGEGEEGNEKEEEGWHARGRIRLDTPSSPVTRSRARTRREHVVIGMKKEDNL